MATTSVVPKIEEERYLTLLQAANAIATAGDCDAASVTLLKKLQEITQFDFALVVVFDKDSDLPCWSLLEASGAKLEVSSEVLNLGDSPIHWVHASGEAAYQSRLERRAAV